MFCCRVFPCQSFDILQIIYYFCWTIKITNIKKTSNYFHYRAECPMVDVEYRYSKNVSGSAHYRLYVTTDTTRADKIFFQIQFDAPVYRDVQQILTLKLFCLLFGKFTTGNKSTALIQQTEKYYFFCKILFNHPDQH